MSLKELFTLGKLSGQDFVADDCATQAAALSYYTVFSLPPLLVLLLMLVGTVLNPEDVRGHLERQISALMGPSAADQIRTILQQAHQPGSGGLLPTLLSILALLLGATGAFGQLQAALDRAWGVKPDPNQGGIKAFLVKRVFTFGMVVSVAFLLLVSLVASAALTAFGDALTAYLPSGLSVTLLQVVNQLISLAAVTLLFATMFKVLPDARLAWRDVWVGSAFTAVLFVVGKFLIGLYLGQSNPGQAFGAAGSLAVLFVWIYYSAMILLLGAEFTQTWAEHRGAGIAPERGAVLLRDRPVLAGRGQA